MKRGTLAVFSLSVVIPSSSQTLLIPAIPMLAEERGFSVTTNGWLLSAFLIAASISAPLVGRIGDLTGRRWLTVLTSAAYVLGSLIGLVGGDHGLALSVGRAFQGLSAGVFVLHIATIQQVVRGSATRAAYIGALSGVVAMGPAVGFLVGGLVTAHLGISALFVLGIGIGVLSTVLLWFWTPVSGGVAEGAVDLRGAMLVALSLLLLLTFLTEVSASGSTGRRVLLALGCTALAVTVTVWWLRRATMPFINLTVLVERVGALGNLATALSAGAMFGLFVAVPQLVQGQAGSGFGLGPVAAGLFLVPGAVVMVLVGPFAGRVGASRGYGRVIIAGNAVCAVGMLALAVLPQTMAFVIILATLAGLGIGIAFPAMPSVVMSVAPRDSVGIAAGINSLSRGVGSAVGAQIVLLFAVTESTGVGAGQRTAFLVGAMCAASAAMAAGGIVRQR